MIKQKNLIIIIFLVLLAIFIFQNSQTINTERTVQFSEFLIMVNNHQVVSADLEGKKIRFTTIDQNSFTTIAPAFYPELSDTLYNNNVRFVVREETSNGLLFNIFVQWLPMIVLVGIWIYFMKKMQGGGKIMGFNRVKPRIKPDSKSDVTFKDVAGIEEAKQELEEIVEFLKDPKKFQNLGGRIPHGVLLCGQPGTGKTLLARAIAGEANVGFFNISGSDFVEMFVGVGAARVRDVFEQARSNSPCIVFIDEIDAVGRSRGSGLGGGNDEREQTLNQILVEMDGFKVNSGIIVVAATNRPDILDPALTRPGRFDRTVFVQIPDKTGRLKILEIHSKKIKLNKDINLDSIAKATHGFTGADLENLVNEAALIAGRQGKDFVFNEDFEEAQDKIIMGSKKRTLTMSKKEIECTAYHEAGHAVIAALSKQLDSLHKVTIVPRGKALGLTMLLPQDDKIMLSKKKIISMLELLMGGRAAEEMIYNHYTTGAQNDLERASEIAHKMVCRWGMSKKIGPFYLSNSDQEVFLGRDMVRRKKISQYTSNLIDQEVKSIINNAYQVTFEKIKENINALHEVAKKLLELETIDGNLVREIVNKN